MSDFLIRADLDLDDQGLVTEIRVEDSRYRGKHTSPIGLKPEAWFAAERGLGRDWEIEAGDGVRALRVWRTTAPLRPADRG